MYFIIFRGRFCGTKNSAVYSMRGTLQYRFTTARVQWPCSTDIHWACLITQSGPARYVTNRRFMVPIERPKAENKLRVRGGFATARVRVGSRTAWAEELSVQRRYGTRNAPPNAKTEPS